MNPRAVHRPIAAAVAIGVVLHTVAVLWAWATWGVIGRGNVLSWLDLPVSLAYLQLDGTPLLVCSLLAGGLQWAAIAAGLTWLVGRAARRA